MTIQPKRTAIGLDGVPAAETVLSHVDGEKGELIIAGEFVGDLARSTSFEGATARLWSLATDVAHTEVEVRQTLGEARAHAFARLSQLLPAADGLSVVDGFRVGVAGLRAENGLSPDAVIVGALPVFAAALVRRRRNEAPIAPDPDYGHAFDTLRMFAAPIRRAPKPLRSMPISSRSAITA